MPDVNIPWAAWYGDEDFKLSFPEEWEVEVARMTDKEDIEDKEIEKSIKNPINSPRLRDIAKGKKSAVVVVDDISRPTQADRLLPHVFEEIEEGGIDRDSIEIILGLGAHRQMDKLDMEKKLGAEVLSEFEIHNHHPYENLIDLGKSKVGTPIKVNRFFMEADLKVAVGCITVHGAAGFGGGGKLVLPGVCGIETLESNHKPAVYGESGGIGVIEGNKLREDIEDIARKVGLNFIVNAVVTSRRGMAGVFAGDLVDAHRAGVDLAKEVYATSFKDGADIGIFNAYPKDTELIQVTNSLNVWHQLDRNVVRKGGVVIMTTACTEGKGFHSLSSKAMRLHHIVDDYGSYGKIFGGRRLIVFSPNLGKRDLKEFFSDKAELFRDWDELISDLKGDFDTAKVTVFPTGTVQFGV